MRLIIKEEEPQCLTDLKLLPGSRYVDLQGPCKEAVVLGLRNEQINVCAYCQRILQTVFIEHYVPQSTNTMQLEYSNFLGVCSGKYYIDKKSGKKIDFCSVYRGSNALTIDPRIHAHVETISYNASNEIISNNATFDNDLNSVLNLNFVEICEDRQEAFDNVLNSVAELGENMDLSKLEIIEKLKRSFQTVPTEFISFLEYRLDMLAEHLRGA